MNFKREDAKDSDLAPFFGDWSQNEKLSEIIPPLASKLVQWLFS